MLKKELSVFFIVGLLTVTVDYLVYRCLFCFYLINIEYSKAIGFIAGSLFAFYVNKHVTFEQKTFDWMEFIRFTTLYASSCLINVCVNKNLLILLNNNERIIWAFLIATSISTTMNFVGMKWFVFKPKSLKGSML